MNKQQHRMPAADSLSKNEPATIMQLSAFPDEKQHKEIKTSKRKRQFLSRMQAYYNKEGAYNFCKLAEEIKSKGDVYCNLHYGMDSNDVYATMNSLFKDQTISQTSIEDFLFNCKNSGSVFGYNISHHKASKK